MGFRVDITDLALGEAEDYVKFIRVDRKEPEAATKWFRGLVSAIFSLEKLPNRHPIVPEQAKFTMELRHLVYFSHRIVYHVDHAKQVVTIFRVYHGSRRPLSPGDLE